MINHQQAYLQELYVSGSLFKELFIGLRNMTLFIICLTL